jgi:hypothetical protein
MGSVATIYICRFINIDSGLQKSLGEGFTDTQTAWRSHKPTLGKLGKNGGIHVMNCKGDERISTKAAFYMFFAQSVQY